MSDLRCGSRDGEYYCLAGHLQADVERLRGEVSKEYMAYCAMKADLARVRAALTKLLGELSDVQIEAVREGCGNTNAACLRQRVVEARATLECHCPSDPRGGHQPHCLRFRAALEGRA